MIRGSHYEYGEGRRHRQRIRSAREDRYQNREQRSCYGAGLVGWQAGEDRPARPCRGRVRGDRVPTRRVSILARVRFGTSPSFHLMPSIPDALAPLGVASRRDGYLHACFATGDTTDPHEQAGGILAYPSGRALSPLTARPPRGREEARSAGRWGSFEGWRTATPPCEERGAAARRDEHFLADDDRRVPSRSWSSEVPDRRRRSGRRHDREGVWSAGRGSRPVAYSSDANSLQPSSIRMRFGLSTAVDACTAMKRSMNTRNAGFNETKMILVGPSSPGASKSKSVVSHLRHLKLMGSQDIRD